MLIRIDASRRAPLVDQIVDGVRDLVDNRTLRPGTRLPSIRRFASDHEVSLVARYLVRPDDVVLVDDPGHFRRFAHMRALGTTVQGVPTTRAGPDLDQLEAIARTLRPRLYITAPIVHNPTGCTISQGKTFRVLKLAERYNFYVKGCSRGSMSPV